MKMEIISSASLKPEGYIKPVGCISGAGGVVSSSCGWFAFLNNMAMRAAASTRIQNLRDVGVPRWNEKKLYTF